MKVNNQSNFAVYIKKLPYTLKIRLTKASASSPRRASALVAAWQARLKSARSNLPVTRCSAVLLQTGPNRKLQQ